MQAPLAHHILGQTFWLHGHRAIFWEEQKALILSDLHFGKTGHFRKAGIAVPQQVYKEDLQRFVSLLQYFSPQQVIAVGDLFHSRKNLELDWFRRWRLDFPHLQFHLVRGNHDILQDQWYVEAEIQLWPEAMEIGPISFAHEWCSNTAQGFTFCGHIHPGIAFNGAGRQSIKLPCFYFTPTHCILPAFSKFTGLALVHPKKGDQVFAIAENTVVPLS
ncbi:ligase-associated DNA damage response endonuclease PdeM [Paracnuella aquatica]|uniref:ligase-associated DNA damage response endonuclease PdeM n=1 Tax=Paracnuella aquatica TaxID=2268757 RepID=UPI000DEF6B5E|nr:ligase-associated DNA damage response endonuclease PdeM [Paracnuella aquatica]RPD48929.1 ligase-associated DNA damage response endonuclease PdeM [Paracnuella aquatica]